MSSRIFLVPHDFTNVGDAAAVQALHLASQTGAEVSLLHIVKSDSEIAAAQSKLKIIVQDLSQKNTTVKVNAFVKKGNIFEDIGSMAGSLKASMIVMGTHGAKGMQKLFGSFAIKVITSTSVPFLVVQDKPAIKRIEKIVFPIDLSVQSIQVLSFASDLAKVFSSEIHIVAQPEKDASLARKINANLTVAAKQFDKSGVNYKTAFLEGSKSYHQKVLDYGMSVGTDMFAISYHVESLLPQFDPFAQSILVNDLKIPTLIINSKQVSQLYY
ncbi:MAG: universal stress protein [Flavobacteriales bacterium]